MHCELPTTFGPRVQGDQRMGKKAVATRVQSKLRKMGVSLQLPAESVGAITLNVTNLAHAYKTAVQGLSSWTLTSG